MSKNNFTVGICQLLDCFLTQLNIYLRITLNCLNWVIKEPLKILLHVLSNEVLIDKLLELCFFIYNSFIFNFCIKKIILCNYSHASLLWNSYSPNLILSIIFRILSIFNLPIPNLSSFAQASMWILLHYILLCDWAQLPDWLHLLFTERASVIQLLPSCFSQIEWLV